MRMRVEIVCVLASHYAYLVALYRNSRFLNFISLHFHFFELVFLYIFRLICNDPVERSKLMAYFHWFTCEISIWFSLRFDSTSYVRPMVQHSDNPHFCFSPIRALTCDFCFHDIIFCRNSILFAMSAFCVSNLHFEQYLNTMIQRSYI